MKISLHLIIICICTFISAHGAQTITTMPPQKTKSVRAFKSPKSMKNAFNALWNREEQLRNHGKLSQNIPETKQFHDDLTTFYMRVFATIVAEDAKNHVLYATDLGITVKKNGQIFSTRLPLTGAQATYQCMLLIRLAANPNDKFAKEELEKLYAKKTRAKNAASLFPKIVFKNMAPDELGEYDEKTNSIMIAKETMSLSEFTTLIHEFTHARQYWTGLARGGFAYHPLVKKKKIGLISARLEIEAEKESFKWHPEPEKLLESIEKDGGAFLPQKESFPYFTNQEQYALLIKHFKLNGSKNYLEKATKEYATRKVLTKKLLKKNSVFDRKKFPSKEYTTLKELHNTTRYEENKYQDKRKNMAFSINATLKNAKVDKEITVSDVHHRGCQAYIKIKQELGLIPK